MNNFERALAVILKEEGGFVKDLDDPGGATNFGITQKTYDRFLTEQDDPVPTVFKLVKKIEEYEVALIYTKYYWLAGSCNKIDSYPIALIHFDGCVNIGVKRAGKLLQQAINYSQDRTLNVDGVIGPLTLKRLNKYFGDHDQVSEEELFLRIWFHRISYYRKLVDKNKKLGKFLRNWIVRMEHINKAADL